MKHLKLFVLGVILGAVGWACSGWFTDRYEPFDSDVGFILNQLLLSVGAIYLGYKHGVKLLALFLLYAYFGLNTHAYIFGGSEFRGWLMLGLLTSLVFFVAPLLLGFIAKSISILRKSVIN